MERVLLAIALSILCLLSTVQAEESSSLHRLVLLTENYGNYNYSLTGREFEHKGEAIGGVSADFIKKLLEKAEIPYKMKLRTWRVSYERALTKPNYGVFSTARTELREDLFDWVGPIARYNWVIFVKKGSNLNINSLDDIQGLRIGGYKNDALTEFVQSKGFEVSALPNESANPQMLHENLIDVWISSDATAWDVAKKAGYEDIEVAFVIRTVDMYLAMNKASEPEWLDQLHKSYDELVAEGELTLSSY